MEEQWGLLYFILLFLGLASLIGYVNPLIGLPCLFIVIVINLMMAFY